MSDLDPVDYSGAFAGATPLQDFGRGYSLGAGVRDDRQQQARQQQALVLQQEEQDALHRFYARPNPTAQDYADVAVRVPTMAAHFRDAYALLDGARRQGLMQTSGQAFSAFSAGDTDRGLDYLQANIDALKNANAPPAEVTAAQRWYDTARAHPEFATRMMGIQLAANVGPERFPLAYTHLGRQLNADEKAPYATRMAAAGAAAAEAKARYAEPLAAAALARASATADTARVTADGAPERQRLAAEDARSRMADRRDRASLDRDWIALRQQRAARAGRGTPHHNSPPDDDDAHRLPDGYSVRRIK